MTQDGGALAPRITIATVGADADLIVTNLFEHYLHDMAEWFGLDTQDDGRYGYHWQIGADDRARWQLGAFVGKTWVTPNHVD